MDTATHRRSPVAVVNKCAHKDVETPILLFDGVCNLCHGTVRFIVKRDRRNRFRFASLQSETALAILQQYGEAEPDLSSVILVYEGRVWEKSSAALKSASQLDRLWPLMGMFWIVPKGLRDLIYDFIGSHRYQWFGRRNVCDLPDIADKGRFLI